MILIFASRVVENNNSNLKKVKITMTSYKEFFKRDASDKYGFSQNGLFAKEVIKKGEIVFRCDENECDYRSQGKLIERGLSRKEIANERHDVAHYSFMIDDDTFLLPKNYMENGKKFSCFCYLFNHSCLPNIGYEDLEMTKHIAIRDINIGDELTIDYQYFSTENSFYTGGKFFFCSFTGRPRF